MVAGMSMMMTSGNDTALLNKPQCWASLYKFLIIKHIEVVSIVHYLLLLYNIRFIALSIMCHTQVSTHTFGQGYVNLGFICAYKMALIKMYARYNASSPFVVP